MRIPNMPTYVEDTHGRTYSVPQLDIRWGGQGIFFPKDDLAVKMLFPEQYSTGHTLEASEKEYLQYQKKLMHLMAMPSLHHLSLPLSALKQPYCGYVMRFMNGLVPLDIFMLVPPKKDGGYFAAYDEKNCSMKKRLSILRNLSDILRNVHNHGLVYCDLTPSNIFASKKPDEAEVWLVDIDNLEYGNSLNSHWQTPWYRAPEVYNGQRNSVSADCYSFALIAFGLLTLSKPFDGTVANSLEENYGWDESDTWGANPQPEEDLAQKKIEAGEMPFIGEPRTKNKQSYGLPYEMVTTETIRDLFFKTLGPTGRKNPNTRPSMNEWFFALDEAIDQIVLCPNSHSIIGKKCFLCGSDALDGQKKVIVNQVNLYAKTSNVGNEDQEVVRVDETKRKVYEMRLSIPKSITKHRKIGTDIKIPWKCFAGSGLYHDPNSIAFSIRFSETGIGVIDCYDSKLKALVKNTNNQQYVSVVFNDRFYYEITVEEVE